MPRIRTLKPEHKQHRKVGPLAHAVYRLWVGLITEADDRGRLVADPRQLAALIFAYHPSETTEKIQRGLETLQAGGLITLYRVAGVQYAEFPSWRDHQRISHPLESKLPPPHTSGNFQNFPEGSAVIPEDSTGIKDQGVDQGVEGRTTLSGSPPDLAPLLKKSLPSQYRQQALEVLQFLNAKTGKAFQPANGTLDPIIARLREGATVGQCKGVIASRARKWRGDEKMAEYLRPKTLFNRTNFAQYQADLPPLEVAGGRDGT